MQIPQSQADDVSVMDHVQYEMKSLLKCTVAVRCLLFRSILRCIISLVPCLTATAPSAT